MLPAGALIYLLWLRLVEHFRRLHLDVKIETATACDAILSLLDSVFHALMVIADRALKAWLMSDLWPLAEQANQVHTRACFFI